MNGQPECLELLLEHGADIEFRCREKKWSALMKAAQRPSVSHTRCVGLLLEVGADVEVADALGDTAAMIAAREGRVESLGLILHSFGRGGPRLDEDAGEGGAIVEVARFTSDGMDGDEAPAKLTMVVPQTPEEGDGGEQLVTQGVGDDGDGVAPVSAEEAAAAAEADAAAAAEADAAEAAEAEVALARRRAVGLGPEATDEDLAVEEAFARREALELDPEASDEEVLAAEAARVRADLEQQVLDTTAKILTVKAQIEDGDFDVETKALAAAGDDDAKAALAARAAELDELEKVLVEMTDRIAAAVEAETTAAAEAAEAAAAAAAEALIYKEPPVDQARRTRLLDTMDKEYKTAMMKASRVAGRPRRPRCLSSGVVPAPGCLVEDVGFHRTDSSSASRFC